MPEILTPKQAKLFNDPRLDELKKRFDLIPLKSKEASTNHRLSLQVEQWFKEFYRKLIIAYAIILLLHTTAPGAQPTPQDGKKGKSENPEGGLAKENLLFSAYMPYKTLNTG